MLGIKVYSEGKYLGWLTNLSMANYTYRADKDASFAKRISSIITARELCDKLVWITYGSVVGTIDTLPKTKLKKRGITT